jgi:DNA mismatch repair protein MutS2
MAISPQTLTTLEFPKVLERLARFTSFAASRELALQLAPSIDPVEVRRRLRLTGEARWLLEERSEISIGGARDVRAAAGLARRGGVLDPAALLEIAATLASGRRLRVLLLKLDPIHAALLQELAEGLPLLPHLEETIAQTIGEDGAVLDSASPKLARLRAEIRVAFNRIQERLHAMLSASQYTEALQEPIITVRNGRYVVPVKSSHRRVIRGLVHDQSSSGATLYVEPMAVVELNNRWRELQSAEEEEVARILAELSERVGVEAMAIVAGVEALAAIDLALAMARYAGALRAVEPEIVEGSVAGGRESGGGDQRSATGDGASAAHSQRSAADAPLALKQARHPLLDMEMVVPIDLWLGGAFRLLLITGPNTGGKTVALKTTGLLALMAQAGLHIPASEPSRMPVLAQVFADIGDEQSIEQSLSTFSSHMTNIIRILRALDSPTDDEVGRGHLEQGAEPLAAPAESGAGAESWSLILLDELGAGTDPVEGAALARAIIERLLDRGVLGVATTHYAELKAFAHATDGVENASVEFDVETLRPTYRLTIGLPGRSNALAIAARLGLDPALVSRARSTMAREDAQVEDLLAGIHRERDAAAAEFARAEELRADAEKYRDRLSAELSDFQQRRDDEWQAARDQIDDELREARSQLKRLRDDFRSVSLTRQWLEDAERRMQEIKAQTPERPPAPPRPTTAVEAPAPDAPRPIQVGDMVLVRSVGLSGEVLSIDEEEQTAEVQVGGFRMQAGLGELRRETKSERSGRAVRPATPERSGLPAVPDVSMNLDLRGWRAAEVADRLDQYLNDAYLAGLPYVRVIHGKGTGALRQVVRDLVGGHPLVASSEGGGKDGGEGVTVVKLISR